MTTANGLCIGPEHALNVHRDCPGCTCSCHQNDAAMPNPERFEIVEEESS